MSMFQVDESSWLKLGLEKEKENKYEWGLNKHSNLELESNVIRI